MGIAVVRRRERIRRGVANGYLTPSGGFFAVPWNVNPVGFGPTTATPVAAAPTVPDTIGVPFAAPAVDVWGGSLYPFDVRDMPFFATVEEAILWREAHRRVNGPGRNF